MWLDDPAELFVRCIGDPRLRPRTRHLVNATGEPRQCHFLVHPDARRGGVAERLRKALTVHAGTSLRPHDSVDWRAARFTEIRSLLDARRAIAALGPDEVPVAAGGDGTVRLVVQALDAEGMLARPFGVVPLGTGNAFAHGAGVATSRAALDALERGAPRGMDLLRTTHPESPLAIASLSMGFEARFVGVYGRHRRRGGRAAAAARAILAGARPRPADFSLRVDGDPWVSAGDRVFNAGLYTLPCYAFGRVVFPTKRAGDGRAIVSLCATGGAYALLLVGHPNSHVRTASAGAAEVDSAGPVQVDGEVVGPGSFEVRVDPSALRVFGPVGPSP